MIKGLGRLRHVQEVLRICAEQGAIDSTPNSVPAADG